MPRRSTWARWQPSARASPRASSRCQTMSSKLAAGVPVGGNARVDGLVPSVAGSKLAAGVPPAGGNGGDGFLRLGVRPQTSVIRRRSRPRPGQLRGGESGFLPSVYSQSTWFSNAPGVQRGCPLVCQSPASIASGSERPDQTSLLSLRPECSCDLLLTGASGVITISCSARLDSRLRSTPDGFHGSLAATQNGNSSFGPVQGCFDGPRLRRPSEEVRSTLPSMRIN